MKNRKSAPLDKPLQATGPLSTIVGSKILTRAQITKKLWAYIEKNKLQDAKNKRRINADAALKALFGGKKSVSMFEMTKLVSKHIKPIKPEPGTSGLRKSTKTEKIPKLAYTFEVTCTFRLQYSFKDAEVEPKAGGAEGDLVPTDGAIRALANEIEETLGYRHQVTDLKVEMDSNDLLGVAEDISMEQLEAQGGIRVFYVRPTRDAAGSGNKSKRLLALPAPQSSR